MNRFKAFAVGVVFSGLMVAAAMAESLPKYIFLFIGDGMGEAQVQAADRVLRDQRIQQGAEPETVEGLAMLSFPVTGSASTFSQNRLVTDSAAAATALSTGEKVPNGAICLEPASGRRLQPMAEFVQRNGWKMGIVSSAAPNHATPAAFFAVAAKRSEYETIARQIPESGVDYFGGPYAQSLPAGKDDLRTLAEAKGYRLAADREAFDALPPGDGKVWAFSPIGPVVDGGATIPLADHTRKAIERLVSPAGFFLMVEGAQIDWAGHANDTIAMIHEVIDFDAAIRVALEFYRAHPEETLIVVTADHETGGLSLDLEKIQTPGLSRAVEALREGRRNAKKTFQEIEKNRWTFEEALPRMSENFALSDLTDQEIGEIREAFEKGGTAPGDFSYSENKRIHLAWLRVTGARLGFRWSTTGHTGDRVPLYAIGAQAHRFGGFSDLALIGRILRDLVEGR
ncbi:MAG: alkaline phosphatase [Kiritimatiellia bacterium]|nr:alkaline phosphatase [Kiritimatiellia bacterium]